MANSRRCQAPGPRSIISANALEVDTGYVIGLNRLRVLLTSNRPPKCIGHGLPYHWYPTEAMRLAKRLVAVARTYSLEPAKVPRNERTVVPKRQEWLIGH